MEEYHRMEMSRNRMGKQKSAMDDSFGLPHVTDGVLSHYVYT